MNVVEYRKFLKGLISDVKGLPDNTKVELVDDYGNLEPTTPAVLRTGEYLKQDKTVQLCLGEEWDGH